MTEPMPETPATQPQTPTTPVPLNGAELEVTVKLPVNSIAQLQAIAQSRSVPPSEALKQVIADQAFLKDLVNNGSKLLIRNPDGTLSLWNP